MTVAKKARVKDINEKSRTWNRGEHPRQIGLKDRHKWTMNLKKESFISAQIQYKQFKGKQLQLLVFQKESVP